MLGLSEIATLAGALVGTGGMLWVLLTKLRERNDEIKAEKEENRRLQEKTMKVTNDAMERRAEEADQRTQGDAAKRLRESKWVRDN